MTQSQKIYKALKQGVLMSRGYAERELFINSPSTPIKKAVARLEGEGVRVKEGQRLTMDGAIYKVWQLRK